MDHSKTNNERLAVLETKVENVEVILTRLETKIDVLSSGFITRDEFNSLKSTRWRDSVILILVSSAIAALITFYVTHHA